jgi:murein DD-endopeptidase MepM/ murein hydrolase activator NlpD
MVKTLSATLVCGIALIAHAYAQEVFSGDQKAKPKYPKAQPAASDQAKSDGPKDKSAAIQPEKVASKTKLEVAQTSKSAELPAKKATSSGPETPALKGATAQNAKSDVTASTKKVVAVTRETTTKASTSSPPSAGKTASIATNKKNVPAAATPSVGKPEAAVAKTGKVVPPSDHPTAVSKAAGPGAQTSKSVATTKASTVETGTAKPTEPLTPAEGPKPRVAEHVSKKAPAGDAKPMTPAPKAVAIAIQHPEDPEDEDSEPRKMPAAKIPATTLPTTKKTIAAVKPSAVVPPPAVSTASEYARKTSDVPAKSMSMHETVSDGSTTATPVSGHFDMAFTKLADGFDFPVGKPDAQGYYKARGFRSHGHLGEDWDGVGGGDTDLGDPIYSIGDGLVVFARDCHMGWGNVLIVRHSYREAGTVKTVDALYGHLNSMLVRRGQAVTRGQKIATMGTAHGLYDAHLHLEVRKNLEIGMSRAAFAQDFSNYYDPTVFIQAHRHLQAGGGSYRVAMNTFTRDARIRWDKTRNYSHAHTGGGTSESAAALKKALAAKP